MCFCDFLTFSPLSLKCTEAPAVCGLAYDQIRLGLPSRLCASQGRFFSKRKVPFQREMRKESKNGIKIIRANLVCATRPERDFPFAVVPVFPTP